MTDARPSPATDFDYVAARLGEAGMTMLALHVPGTRPAGWRGYWPEIPGQLVDGDRPPPPAAKRITRMDEALGWIGLIPADKIALRRVVGLRALTSPKTERVLLSWRAIGQELHCSDFSAKAWWISGIDLIVARLNQAAFCQQPVFRRTRTMTSLALQDARDRLAAGAPGARPRKQEQPIAEVCT